MTIRPHSKSKAEKRVIAAAMSLRDKEGWIFRYSRDDVKYQIVDQPKMRRLEKALDALAELRKRK